MPNFSKFELNKEDLDACHMYMDRERVIVKFCQKEDYPKILKDKNNLRKLNTTNQDLPEGSKISYVSYVCFVELF